MVCPIVCGSAADPVTGPRVCGVEAVDRVQLKLAKNGRGPIVVHEAFIFLSASATTTSPRSTSSTSAPMAKSPGRFRSPCRRPGRRPPKGARGHPPPPSAQHPWSHRRTGDRTQGGPHRSGAHPQCTSIRARQHHLKTNGPGNFVVTNRRRIRSACGLDRPCFARKRGGGVQGRAGLFLRGKKRKAFVASTETNLHADALCFMVKTWTIHKTIETVSNNGWRFGGGWRLVAVGGWRRLAAGGP